MMLQAPGMPQANAPDLRDIHLPPDPSWWPPAPGWWLSALLLAALLLAVGWAWRQWIRRRRERRRVLEEIEYWRRQHERDADDARLAGALHQLLRRVARLHDPAAVRQQGDAWRTTLQRVPVDAQTLQQLLALEQAMYRPDAPFEASRALAAVRTWLHLALRPRNWKPAVSAHA